MCLYHPVCFDNIVREQLCILILSHWLWLVIALVTARHSVFLAQIPVHSSSHCVMSRLILVLC